MGEYQQGISYNHHRDRRWIAKCTHFRNTTRSYDTEPEGAKGFDTEVDKYLHGMHFVNDMVLQNGDSDFNAVS